MVGRPSRLAPSRVRHPSARLRLEQLEDRSLLAVNALAPAADHLLITTKDGAFQKIKIDEGTSVDEALSATLASPDVQAAEADWTVSVSVTPNDTKFGELYGLHNTGQSSGTSDADIDAAEAWDVTQGSLKIVVGVIDTGIDYTHKDLYKNIWLNQGEITTSNFTDTDSDGLITFWDLNETANKGKVTDANKNGYIDGADVLKKVADGGLADAKDNDNNGKLDDLIGWDFISEDNDPFDDHSHGTHVAGTIGAMTDNNEGVSGVNWKVQMAGLKFLSSAGSGSISDAREALDYAVAKGMQISNNSWGGGGFSQSFSDSLTAAKNKGHIFVAAAGNAANDNDTTASYPASYGHDNIISVAATDRNDKLASFSNYGKTTVDIGAPGVNTVSTTPNNSYATFSGTSMASPHVAGVAALVWGKDSSLAYSDVISRILNNGDSVTALTNKVATGRRLNAYNAVTASSVDNGGPRVTGAVVNNAQAPSSVRVTFSKAINLATFGIEDITGFTGPKGLIGVSAVKVVANSGDKQFDITFATQTTQGDYSFTLGPNIADKTGNLMDQNSNGKKGEETDNYKVAFRVSSSNTFEFSNNNRTKLVDWGTTRSTILVNQAIKITDINVTLDITHTWDSDLVIKLKGPNGKEITLVNRRGGAGDNFTSTVLDDEATTLVRNGRAPFRGSFKPEQALTVYDNISALGAWVLSVTDVLPFDEGTLNSWKLTITGTLQAGGRSVEGDIAAPVEATPEAASTAGVVAASARGNDLSSLAMALGREDTWDAFAPVSFTQRRDTSEPALIPEALLPSRPAQPEVRDLALSGLARRVRPAAFGWSASWDEGAEE